VGSWEHGNEPSDSIKGGYYYLLKMVLLHGINCKLTFTVPVCFITALITGKEFHVNHMITPKVSAE
jgi:hypothetical protein